MCGFAIRHRLREEAAHHPESIAKGETGLADVIDLLALDSPKAVETWETSSRSVQQVARGRHVDQFRDGISTILPTCRSWSAGPTGRRILIMRMLTPRKGTGSGGAVGTFPSFRTTDMSYGRTRQITACKRRQV